MESVVHYLTAYNLDIATLGKAAAVLIGAFVLLALCGRFIFGKKSTLVFAVSSAIGILLIYILAILLGGTGEALKRFIAPLPFVTFQGDKMYLFDFHTNYTTVCGQVLGMIILSFLMNLIDSILPTGKNFFVWVLLRCVSLLAAIILHYILGGLLIQYLPNSLVTYAPVILLGILIVLLLTGALRFLVGLALTTVNPLIAALYTFFFANIIGKQITKAILTTGILTGLVLLLREMGIVALSLASVAFTVYIPLILLLVIMWYIISKQV